MISPEGNHRMGGRKAQSWILQVLLKPWLRDSNDQGPQLLSLRRYITIAPLSPRTLEWSNSRVLLRWDLLYHLVWDLRLWKGLQDRHQQERQGGQLWEKDG